MPSLEVYCNQREKKETKESCMTLRFHIRVIVTVVVVVKVVLLLAVVLATVITIIVQLEGITQVDMFQMVLRALHVLGVNTNHILDVHHVIRAQR